MKLTVLDRVGRKNQAGKAEERWMRIFMHENLVIFVRLALDVHTASFPLCYPKTTRKKDGDEKERSYLEDLVHRNEVRWWEWTKSVLLRRKLQKFTKRPKRQWKIS
jgi:hypothetical protein